MLKKFKNVIVLTLVLFVFINMFLVYKPTKVLALNTSYYVSNSVGNDSYDGLAPAWDGTHGPWKTLAKAGQQTYSAGDQILLKCGDSWNECLTINSEGNRTSYGTSSNPIVISAYGTGDMPKILRNSTRTPVEFCIQINEASGWKITNLEIGNSTFGIDFHYYSTYNNNYLWVENCYFHDIDGSNYFGRTPTENLYYGFSSAVQVSGPRVISSSAPYVTDITVQNCSSDNAKTLFYNGSANADAVTRNIKNVTLKNNIMSGGTWGWCLHFVDTATVDNCKSLNAGSQWVEVGAAGGVCHGSKDVVIKNSEFGYCKFVETDGVGFDFEGRNNNVSLINCDIHDNEESGILLYNNYGYNFNCSVYNVNMINNGYGAYTTSCDFKQPYRDDLGTVITYVRTNKSMDGWGFPSAYRLENNYYMGSTPSPLNTAGYPYTYNDNSQYIVYSASRNGTVGVDPTGNNNPSLANFTYSANRGLGDIGDDLHYTADNQAWAQFTFIGTGIDYICPKNSNEGNVDVYIDGTYNTTVNCYASSYTAQQTVFSKTDLTNGPHNIKVVKTSGTYMCVDAFKVYRASSSAPTPVPTALQFNTINQNCALGAAALASTNYSADYNSSKANDNNVNTKWTAASGFSNNQWLQINLLYPVTFDKVELLQDSSLTRISSYKIQYIITTTNPSNPPSIKEFKVFKPDQQTFKDDFGSWTANSGTWTIVDGEYCQSNTSDWGYNTVLTDRKCNDGTYEFDFKIIDYAGDTSNWAGYQFRKTYPGDTYSTSGYLVYMCANGNVSLYKPNTVLQTVASGLDFSTFKHVKIVTSGSNIKVYLNGSATASIDYNDTTYTSGYAGFATGKTHSHFDNVNIY